MEEVWKPIKNYEYYEVSNLGRVKSLDRIIKRRNSDTRIKGKILCQAKNGSGYFVVTLYRKSKGKTYYIHRLVATGFCSNDGFPMVNHINSIVGDNRAENLEWCTAKENIHHGIKFGNIDLAQCRGEKCGTSKLTEDEVIQIREIHANTKCTQRSLSKKFGVTYQTINAIILRKTWKYV